MSSFFPVIRKVVNTVYQHYFFIEFCVFQFSVYWFICFLEFTSIQTLILYIQIDFIIDVEGLLSFLIISLLIEILGELRFVFWIHFPFLNKESIFLLRVCYDNLYHCIRYIIYFETQIFITIFYLEDK